MKRIVRKILRVKARVEKRIKKLILRKKDFESITFSNFWLIGNMPDNVKLRKTTPNIFGVNIDHSHIQWHRDYVAGFEYPKVDFDKIKISRYYGKGIDVKFPWELSRCYFFVAWGQNYHITGQKKYYILFKETLNSWIKDNPYLTGVNWVCTMEVAIRATNWIVAAELFRSEIDNDPELQRIISVALLQHAYYVDWFTEKIGNNHDISNYAGLLFLSLFLSKYPKSEKWKAKAIKGLEDNMQKQVLDDGVSYELSTSYHRLVLEFFAYAAIAGKLSGIPFSKNYYTKLFRMFEFAAAYMNHNGLSPQIGDNDSGRFLIFHESACLDHKYLLNLGEMIFDYTFKTQCTSKELIFDAWIPEIQSIPYQIDQQRDTSKSIAFTTSGFYFLKSKKLNIMINANNMMNQPIRGHKHFDIGSYALSFNGCQLVIDLGTYTYTRSLLKRNYFRSIYSHNNAISELTKDEQITNHDNFWGGNILFPKIEVLEFHEQWIELSINYLNSIVSRKFSIDNNESLCVIDSTNGNLTSLVHTKEPVRINEQGFNFGSNELSFKCNNASHRPVWYSDSYGSKKLKATKIVLRGTNEIKYILKLI